MSSKKLRELEIKLNSEFFIVQGIEPIRGGAGRGISSLVMKARFHELLIGLPRSGMLQFILARTLAYGKVWAFISDTEFVHGIPGLLKGCISERTLFRAKPYFLEHCFIRSLRVFTGQRQIGTAYALNPPAFVGFGGSSWERFPDWRQTHITEISHLFDHLQLVPVDQTIDLRERENGNNERKSKSSQGKK